MKSKKVFAMKLLTLALVSLLLHSGEVFSQSAIRQLQQISGGTIDQSSYSSSGYRSNFDAQAWAERRAEIREQRREEAARKSISLNNSGNAAFSRSNWSEAVKYYRKAHRLNPRDAVIKQNLDRAKENLDQVFKTSKGIKEYNKMVEERKKEEAQKLANFQKQKQPLVAMLNVPSSPIAKQNQPVAPLASTKTPGGFSSPGIGRIREEVKIGGLTQTEWIEAAGYQQGIDQINKKWPLSNDEITKLDQLVAKRNELWRKAISVPGLTANDRERMRLKLYTDQIYLKNTTQTLSPTKLKEWKTLPEERQPEEQNKERKEVNIISKNSPAGLIFTSVSDLTEDKLNKTFEDMGEDYAKENLGEVVGPMFGNTLGVTKIVYVTKTEGIKAGVEETIDFVVGKLGNSRIEDVMKARKIMEKNVKSAFSQFCDEVNKFNEAFNMKPIPKPEIIQDEDEQKK